MEALNTQYEVRNAVSDLVCLIDIAEMTDSDKIDAINYALKQLNDLKEELGR
jgi:predicted MarR family transcription regulator